MITTDTIEKRPFGKTGLHVSALGFGGAPIGYLSSERRDVEQLLNEILDNGINVIDTAANYHGSEEMIGHAIGHRRDEFVLITKCGHSAPNLEGEEWSPEVITQAVEQSLKRLRTDRLDVVLLHTCDLLVLNQGDAMAALVKARDAGKVRFIGYSGDNEEAAYAAHLPEVDVIEMSVNICDQTNLDVVLPKARERGIGVIAKRPLANAAWRPVEERPGIYASYGAPYSERLKNMAISPRDLGFKNPPAEAWPEIALRFTLAQPGIATAIIGTTNLRNAEANLRAAAKDPLPETVVKKIRNAFRSASTNTSDGWPGLA